MKIKLGPAGVPTVSKEHSTLAGIQTVKELGLQAMEVEFVRGVKMSNQLAKQAGELSRKLGIELSVHAPYYVNLCNPEKLKASQKRIIESCEKGHHMGATVVVFHPGYYGKLEKEEALERVTEACREMADVIKEQNWKVKLGPETTGKVSQFGTVDEILSICKAVKQCVPVLDWAHLFAKYQGKVDFRQILDKVISAGYRKIHTHFSCIEFTEKGERRHLPLDTKKPDYSNILRIILKSRLDEITMISESPALEQDALKLKKMLEKEGYKF